MADVGKCTIMDAMGRDYNTVISHEIRVPHEPTSKKMIHVTFGFRKKRTHVPSFHGYTPEI